MSSIRPYRHSDLDSLLRIYRESITHLGGSRYTPEQVRAWSGYFDEPAAFGKWLGRSDTVVAVDEAGQAIGFGSIEDTGRIASLFVAPSAMRRGVGMALLSRLLDEARTRGMTAVTAQASEFSRPLFEQFGFETAGIEHTEVEGAAFVRYAMWSPL